MKKYLEDIDRAIKSEKTGKINIYFGDSTFIDVSKFQIKNDDVVTFYNDNILTGSIPYGNYTAKPSSPYTSSITLEKE
ncbi:MAG: hypothetical protein ABRQ25_18460 [Clostridiaceae bacterium]